jgi:hypothetical protein
MQGGGCVFSGDLWVVGRVFLAAGIDTIGFTIKIMARASSLPGTFLAPEQVVKLNAGGFNILANWATDIDEIRFRSRSWPEPPTYWGPSRHQNWASGTIWEGLGPRQMRLSRDCTVAFHQSLDYGFHQGTAQMSYQTLLLALHQSKLALLHKHDV